MDSDKRGSEVGGEEHAIARTSEIIFVVESAAGSLNTVNSSKDAKRAALRLPDTRVIKSERNDLHKAVDKGSNVGNGNASSPVSRSHSQLPTSSRFNHSLRKEELTKSHSSDQLALKPYHQNRGRNVKSSEAIRRNEVILTMDTKNKISENDSFLSSSAIAKRSQDFRLKQNVSSVEDIRKSLGSLISLTSKSPISKSNKKMSNTSDSVLSGMTATKSTVQSGIHSEHNTAPSSPHLSFKFGRKTSSKRPSKKSLSSDHSSTDEDHFDDIEARFLAHSSSRRPSVNVRLAANIESASSMFGSTPSRRNSTAGQETIPPVSRRLSILKTTDSSIPEKLETIPSPIMKAKTDTPGEMTPEEEEDSDEEAVAKPRKKKFDNDFMERGPRRASHRLSAVVDNIPKPAPLSAAPQEEEDDSDDDEPKKKKKSKIMPTEIVKPMSTDLQEDLVNSDQIKIPIVTKLLLSAKSVGNIYCDIGISPLFVFHALFFEYLKSVKYKSDFTYAKYLTEDVIVGVLSAIIWISILIVCVKYVTLVIHADNGGEGGIFALVSMLTDRIPPAQRYKFLRLAVFAFAFIGASCVLGDSIIAPAISVIAALEGMSEATASYTEKQALYDAAIPMAIVILLALFFVQQYGVDKLSLMFVPVMFCWFFTLGFVGIYNLALANTSHLTVLVQALNPWMAIRLLVGAAGDTSGLKLISPGLTILGSLTLSVVGIEALYAELGSYSRTPIRLSWFFVIFPSLILNYFGQAALLLRDPETAHNPFFAMFPAGPARIYSVVIALLASIIASQGSISGSFSLINQAISLRYFPGVSKRHTSHTISGQVYIPVVNWFLMVSSIVLLVTFKTSSDLAGAYAVATSSAMLVTTLLFILVQIYVWKSHWSLTLLYACVYLTLDGSLFVANVFKLASGGWVSIVLGGLFGVVMWIWYSTTQELNKETKKNALQMESLLKMIKKGVVMVEVATDPEEVKRQALRKRRKASVLSVEEENKAKLSRRKTDQSMDLENKRVTKMARTVGTGVFIDTQQQDNNNHVGKSKKQADVPAVMTAFISRIPVLPETIVILSIQFLPIPFIAEEDRLLVRPVDENLGVYRIILNHGYQETDTDIVGILERARSMGIQNLDSSTCIFFVGKTSVELKVRSLMAEAMTNEPKGIAAVSKSIKNLFHRFRISWYEMINKNVNGQKEMFKLPHEYTIEVGNTIAL